MGWEGKGGQVWKYKDHSKCGKFGSSSVEQSVRKKMKHEVVILSPWSFLLTSVSSACGAPSQGWA